MFFDREREQTPMREHRGSVGGGKGQQRAFAWGQCGGAVYMQLKNTICLYTNT